VDNKPVTTDASSQADDWRYPRPLWIRIPRWIANHILAWIVEDIILYPWFFRWRTVFLIGFILYLLGIIYNLSALVVHNHNNFGILLIGTNIIQALPFNQLFPLLVQYWWEVLLSLLGLIVVSIGAVFLVTWADEDKTNESKELEWRRGMLSSSQPDDLRYPRSLWIRIIRWVFIRWWLVLTPFLAIYILNAIFSFYSLIAHNGFAALLTFSNIAHALLFDALGQNWLVVLLSALVMVMVGRGLWSWADEDKKNESKELERRRLNQIEEQEKQQPPGIQLRHTLRWEGKTFNQIVWSPDGLILACNMVSAYSPRGDFELWDTKTGQLIRTFFKEGFRFTNALAWSPDGLILAAAQSSTIQLWDTKTGQLLRTLTGESSDSIKGLAWSPDGLILAAAASRSSTSLAWTIPRSPTTLAAAASRSSTSRSSSIELWDVKTGQLLRTLPGESFSIDSLAWSPDGLILASAVFGTIQLWDTKNWQPHSTLKARVNSIAWSPDGQTLVLASNQIILLWDPKTGRQRGSLEGHTAGVLCVAFSYDGRLLASKSSDNTVRLWRTDTWETVAVLNESSNPGGSLFLRGNPAGLAFHPKMASVLATLGVEDTVIRIWDLDLSTLFGLSPFLDQIASSQTRFMDSPSEPVARVAISSPRPSPDSGAIDQEAEPIANVLTHPVTPATPRIFVSHSSQDDDFGVRLVEDLRRALGSDDAVWYDSRGGLHGGDSWWSKIVQEVATRDIFIIVLSPNSMSSYWVLRELDMAVIQRKQIIPLHYHPCDVRADLLTIQIINFLPPKAYEAALNELFAALELPSKGAEEEQARKAR
jgi:WD40 repeat protein